MLLPCQDGKSYFAAVWLLQSTFLSFPTSPPQFFPSPGCWIKYLLLWNAFFSLWNSYMYMMNFCHIHPPHCPSSSSLSSSSSPSSSPFSLSSQIPSLHSPHYFMSSFIIHWVQLVLSDVHQGKAIHWTVWPGENCGPLPCPFWNADWLVWCRSCAGNHS